METNIIEGLHLALKKQYRILKDKLDNPKRIQFYNKFLKPNDLVYDVGANIGNRVHAFLDLGCKVVAVEPQEACCRTLEKRFGNTIDIVKKGLGAQEDEKEMYISNESTLSTLSEEWIDSMKKNRFKEYNWDKTVKIPMTTLDHLIQQYGKPVFCKIDVEGYEYNVLQGLSQPVKFISFEYAVPENMNRMIDCINYCIHLDPDYKFNYSVGESMQYQLPEFICGTEMLKHVQTSEFLQSEFGDIYVSSSKLQ